MSHFGKLAVVLATALSHFAHPTPAAEPLKVCILAGSNTYHTELTLPPFKKFLENNYNIRCTYLEKKAVDDLPGLEQLDDCEVAFVYIKRMKLAGEQLERFKKFANSGKPIVGLRTASHAVQTWLEFDKEVLGGNYHGHFPVGPITKIETTSAGAIHPILRGVKLAPAPDALYKNDGHAADIEILLNGTIPGEPTMPLAWTREHKGGRVFYTSLGAEPTMEDANFRRMLVNALYWTTKREVEPK